MTTDELLTNINKEDKTIAYAAEKIDSKNNPVSGRYH